MRNEEVKNVLSVSSKKQTHKRAKKKREVHSNGRNSLKGGIERKNFQCRLSYFIKNIFISQIITVSTQRYHKLL